MVGSSAPGEAGPGAPAPAPGSAQHLGMAGPTEATYSRHKAGGRDRGQTKSRLPTEPVLCPGDSLRFCNLAEGPPTAHPTSGSPASPLPAPSHTDCLTCVHTREHTDTHIYTHAMVSATSGLCSGCLECYPLPCSLYRPAHSFGFHFTSSRKSSLSAQAELRPFSRLMGLISSRGDETIPGISAGCFGLQILCWLSLIGLCYKRL